MSCRVVVSSHMNLHTKLQIFQNILDEQTDSNLYHKDLLIAAEVSSKISLEGNSLHELDAAKHIQNMLKSFK